MNGDRPFRLECWEMDPDLVEETWRQWSTYQTATNALERRDKLRSKGHKARVVDSRTGVEVTGQEKTKKLAPCPVCGEPHEGPYDGSCLL